MGEPRPVFVLLALQGLAALALAGWWVLRPPAARLTMLARVADAEQARGPVPLAVQGQAEWLVRHRLGRLQGMTGLGALALVVGVAEGIQRRRRAVYGGFLLKAWVTGTIAFPVVIGVAASYLVVPYPLSQVWYGMGLSSVVGVMSYGLASGRPYIP